jgi:putative ABC transport system permease protein
MGLFLGEAARLSFRNLRRRSAIPVLLALLIPSASILVPLTMGASFEDSLRQDIYDSLGAVDEIVRSQGVMRPELFDAVANDTQIAGLTDGLAPALMLQGILTGPSEDRRDTQVDFIGIDQRASKFGGFAGGKGERPGLPIAPGEVYLREDCAQRIGVSDGDSVDALLRDPAFSLESVYTPGAPAHSVKMKVAAAIERSGLGALKLVPRGPDRRTAFVDLGWLREQTKSAGINAILVSNNGDARAGLAGTSAVSSRLQVRLEGIAGYEEGGLVLTATSGYLKLESQNIFFSGRYADLVRATDSRLSAISAETSYFVNMLEHNGSHVAYSTVTAFDAGADAPFGLFTDNATGLCVTGEPGDDEIVLTGYTAERLGAGVGDSVTLNYTVYDSAFLQKLRYETFRVCHIVELAGKADDPQLMPPFPGIKGKASCGDWKPPVPIDFGIMVQEDLRYWQEHGGAPKAYISLAAGKRLWGNDLGNITTVKALPGSGVNTTALARIVGDGLNASLSPEEMGVFVEKVKQDGIDSVAGLFIVTEALLAFGTAVTASGMVLIYVVVTANIEARRRELGILRSMGLTRRNIATVLSLEGVVLSLAGSLLGVAAGFAFAGIGVWASNTLWAGVLPADSALFPPGPEMLVSGFLAGFIVSVLAFYLGARSASRGSVSAGIRGLPEETPPAPTGGRAGALFGAYVVFVAALFVAGYLASAASGDLLLLYYFAFGDLLLLVTGYVIFKKLDAIAAALSRRARLGRIPLENASRNRKRTGAYIVVYALVVFPLLTLSAYLPMQTGSISEQAALRGGGYDILGTSEVPLFFDLANASERAGHNISAFPNVSVVQFLSYGSPGGTCTNLNTKAPPRILAASEAFLAESKIPVSDSIDKSGGKEAWKLLERDEGKGVVPAIGDYTTIVWIFEKGIGSTIEVTDEFGSTVQLKIVAILRDSIFQGSVFISGANMRVLYPTLSQYNTFLFKLPPSSTEKPGTVASALENSLSGYGLSARPVGDIVRELIAVDLVYVSMLQAMLASGLVLGTVGFAAKVSRETLERRYELGVMRALGFRRGQISELVLWENLLIFLLGFGLALGSAAAASVLFLKGLPALVDTLVVLTLLFGVISLSTLWPVRRFNARSPADVLRLPE